MRLTPLQWRQKRRWLREHPRPADPPPGMMLNPLADQDRIPWVPVKDVERIARAVMAQFDSRPPKLKQRIRRMGF